MNLRRLLGQRPTLRLAKWAGLCKSAAKSKTGAYDCQSLCPRSGSVLHKVKPRRRGNTGASGSIGGEPVMGGPSLGRINASACRSNSSWDFRARDGFLFGTLVGGWTSECCYRSDTKVL